MDNLRHKTTDHYKLALNRKLIYLFGQNDWTLRDLLGEAINALCAKYRKPQPYTRED